MTVATYVPANNTTQDAATYKATIDGDFAVVERISALFAPQQSSTPNMTVTIRPGAVMDNSTLTEIAQQVTTVIAAPVANPRIDRIVLDQRTYLYSIITGTPNASPVPPAIPAGKVPCAQILLQTTSTTIVNSMITDERCFQSVSGAYVAATFALLAGSATQVFSVAAATALDHAPRADQMQTQGLTAYTTGGSSTAYTLTTLATAVALTTNERFRVKFHATAGASPTLNRDGKGAVALSIYNSAGAKVAASASSIIAGMLADVEYDGTNYVILDQLPPIVATAAEVSTGTDNTKMVTALALSGAVTELTTANVLSSSNVQTMAHGLGRKPRSIVFCLLVTTASDGWSVGDEIYSRDMSVGGIANADVCVGADNTNIVVACASGTVAVICNKTTGAYASPALGNFKLRVRVT